METDRKPQQPQQQQQRVTFQISRSDTASISCIVETFNGKESENTSAAASTNTYSCSTHVGFANHPCESYEVFSLLDYVSPSLPPPLFNAPAVAAADRACGRASGGGSRDGAADSSPLDSNLQADTEIVQLCQFNNQSPEGETEIILVFATNSGRLYKMSFILSHFDVFLSLNGYGNYNASATATPPCTCQFCSSNSSGGVGVNYFAEGTLMSYIFSCNNILYLMPRDSNLLIAADMITEEHKFSVEFPACDRNLSASSVIVMHDNNSCHYFQKEILGHNSSVKGCRIITCVGTENGSVYVFLHPRDELLSLGAFTLFPKLIHSVNCKVDRIFRSNFSYYFNKVSPDHSKLSGAVFENGVSHLCIADEESNMTCIGLCFIKDVVMGCNFVVELPPFAHSIVVFENIIIYADTDGKVYGLQVMLESPMDVLHKMFIEQQLSTLADSVESSDDFSFNIAHFRKARVILSPPILLSSSNNPSILALESVYSPISQSNYSNSNTTSNSNNSNNSNSNSSINIFQPSQSLLATFDGDSNYRVIILTERSVDLMRQSAIDVLLTFFGNKHLSSSSSNSSVSSFNGKGASIDTIAATDSSAETAKTKLNLSIQLETCYRQVLFEINSEILQKAALLSFIREFNDHSVNITSSKYINFDVQVLELASRENYLRIKLSVYHSSFMKALNGKYISFSFSPLSYPSSRSQTVDSSIDSILFEDISTSINGGAADPNYQCFFEIPVVIPNEYSQCKLEINLLMNLSDKYVDNSQSNANIFSLKESKFIHSKKFLHHFPLYSSKLNLSTAAMSSNSMSGKNREGDILLDSPWSKKIEMLSTIMRSLNEPVMNSVKTSANMERKIFTLEYFFPKLVVGRGNNANGDENALGLFRSGSSSIGSPDYLATASSSSTIEPNIATQGQAEYDSMLRSARDYLRARILNDSSSSSSSSGGSWRAQESNINFRSLPFSPKFSKILSTNDYSDAPSNKMVDVSSSSSSSLDFRIAKETLHFNSGNSPIPSINCDVAHVKYDDFQAACQILNRLTNLSIDMLTHAYAAASGKTALATSGSNTTDSNSVSTSSASNSGNGGSSSNNNNNNSQNRKNSNDDYDNFYTLPDRLRHTFSQLLDIYSFFKEENGVTELMKLPDFQAAEGVDDDDGNHHLSDERLESQVICLNELKQLFADTWKMFTSLRE